MPYVFQQTVMTTPGGIRTPDRRIRDPLPDRHKDEIRNNLGPRSISGCTDGCTPKLENDISDPNLIRLIELWPSLPVIEQFAVLEYVAKQAAAAQFPSNKSDDESREVEAWGESGFNFDGPPAMPNDYRGILS